MDSPISSPPSSTETHPQPSPNSTSAPIIGLTNIHHIITIKLTHENFLLWRAQVTPYLRGQHVYGFVDGTNPPPPTTIPNPTPTSSAAAIIPNPAFYLWSQQDQIILSTLISSLSENILSHVIGCTTSRDLWLSHERMFISQSQARITCTHYQLATMKKGSSTISEYFEKMKILSDTLAATGQPLNPYETVSYLLAGLGTEYDPFVTFVTTSVDPLPLDELYGHLLAHEQRLEQHQIPTDLAMSSANMASRNHPNQSKN